MSLEETERAPDDLYPHRGLCWLFRRQQVFRLGDGME
jgi:hypothetical protein